MHQSHDVHGKMPRNVKVYRYERMNHQHGVRKDVLVEPKLDRWIKAKGYVPRGHYMELDATPDVALIMPNVDNVGMIIEYDAWWAP